MVLAPAIPVTPSNTKKHKKLLFEVLILPKYFIVNTTMKKLCFQALFIL